MFKSTIEKIRDAYDVVKKKINNKKGDISIDIKRIEETNYTEPVYGNPAIIQLLEKSGNRKKYVFDYETGEIITTGMNNKYPQYATLEQIVTMVAIQIKDNKSDITDSDEIIINEVKNDYKEDKIKSNFVGKKKLQPHIENLIKTKYEEYLKKKTNSKTKEYKKKLEEERKIESERKLKSQSYNQEQNYTEGPSQLVDNRVGGKKHTSKKRTRKNRRCKRRKENEQVNKNEKKPKGYNKVLKTLVKRRI